MYYIYTVKTSVHLTLYIFMKKMKILYIWITFYECKILCQNNILNIDV